MYKYFSCIILSSMIFLGCNGSRAEPQSADTNEYARLTYLRPPDTADTYYEWISGSTTVERTSLQELSARLGIKDKSPKHSYDIVRYLLLQGWELVGVTDSNPSKVDNAIYPTKETYHFVRKISN